MQATAWTSSDSSGGRTRTFTSNSGKVTQRELTGIEEYKQSRLRSNQDEANRHHDLEEEFKAYRHQAKQSIRTLQAEIENYVEEKRQLQKEFSDLEDNIVQKYELNQHLMQKEIATLKQDRETTNELHTEKIVIPEGKPHWQNQ